MSLRKSRRLTVATSFTTTMRKEMLQLRPLNPPSFNARFQRMLKDENPEYTLVEAWKNVQVMEEEAT